MITAACAACDVLLGLMRTWRKLEVSFYRDLGDHLHVPGAIAIPPLPDLFSRPAFLACRLRQSRIWRLSTPIVEELDNVPGTPML